MPAELDHIFVCTSEGAPAADRLRDFGLTEGPPNMHPGQGTSCRRFFFHNFMLELLWMRDEVEARSAQTRRTRLWDRCTAADVNTSPFGVILRPGPDGSAELPFRSWIYEPATMPGFSLHIAEDTSMDEPMWCYFPAVWPRREPLPHKAGLRMLTGVRLLSPPLAAETVTMSMARSGILAHEAADRHHLNLQFDGGARGESVCFAPDLPITIHA